MATRSRSGAGAVRHGDAAFRGDADDDHEVIVVVQRTGADAEVAAATGPVVAEGRPTPCSPATSVLDPVTQLLTRMFGRAPVGVSCACLEPLEDQSEGPDSRRTIWF
jgi:hypothetical protein